MREKLYVDLSKNEPALSEHVKIRDSTCILSVIHQSTLNKGGISRILRSNLQKFARLDKGCGNHSTDHREQGKVLPYDKVWTYVVLPPPRQSYGDRIGSDQFYLFSALVMWYVDGLSVSTVAM